MADSAPSAGAVSGSLAGWPSPLKATDTGAGGACCAVDPPHKLEFKDGFADADGNPSPDTPTAVIRVALSELAGGGTQMDITTAWASVEAMEQILAMGTDDTVESADAWTRLAEAGMTAAVRQIDELLGLPARPDRRLRAGQLARKSHAAPMVIAAGHTIAEPQQRESYLAGCMSVVEQARGIAGCLDFAITADPLDPGRVNNFERWESQAAVEAVRGSSPSGEQAAAMLSASVAEYDIADVRPSFVSTAKRHGEAS